MEWARKEAIVTISRFQRTIELMLLTRQAIGCRKSQDRRNRSFDVPQLTLRQSLDTGRHVTP